MRSPLVLASISIALLTPAVASATATFPDAVQTHLGLTYAPPCTICHTTQSGGTGTVTKAFGKAMRQNGLQSGNTTSVQSALDALDAANTDSDCDGVNDVAQLKEGREPNTGEYIDGSGKTNPPASSCAGTGGNGASSDPAYGCGAQLAEGPVTGSAWAAVAAVLTVLGLGASRRRRLRLR
jgi:hypothetical protein